MEERRFPLYTTLNRMEGGAHARTTTTTERPDPIHLSSSSLRKRSARQGTRYRRAWSSCMTGSTTNSGQGTPNHLCPWHGQPCMVPEYLATYLGRLMGVERFERSHELKLTHWPLKKVEDEGTVELHKLREDYKAEARRRGHNVSDGLNGNLEAILRASEHKGDIDWDRNTGRIDWKGYGTPPARSAPPPSPRPLTQCCTHGNLLSGRPVQGRWISLSCRTCRG